MRTLDRIRFKFKGQLNSTAGLITALFSEMSIAAFVGGRCEKMVTILLVIVICAAISAMIYPVLFKHEFEGKLSRELYYVIMLIVIAVSVRVICAFQYTGHSYDTSCFRSWASRLAGSGFAAFYSSDNFNNYPPGYMYVLWIIGKLNAHFGFSTEAFNIVLKIPAMIADILSGIFVYKLAKKKFSVNKSLIILSAWLFNPAVITDSSLWGQVDILYTFFIGLMLYFIAERKLIYSYFMFAVCILLKPQSFILTPILIYGIIDQVFLRGFDKRIFLKNLIYGLAAIAMIFVAAAPFGIGYAFEQYKETLHGSEYIVQNAFNLWGALGKNYNWITTSASVIGYILLAVSVAFTAFIFFKAQGKEKVYFTGAFLLLCSFMLSVKMNERYAFAVMMYLLLAYIEKPSKNNALSYMLITLSQFFNIAWVLFIFEQDFYKYYPSKWICLYSAINVVIFAYVIYVALKDYCNIFNKEKKFKKSVDK